MKKFARTNIFYGCYFGAMKSKKNDDTKFANQT
jgi:hypothetical protein